MGEIFSGIVAFYSRHLPDPLRSLYLRVAVASGQGNDVERILDSRLRSAKSTDMFRYSDYTSSWSDLANYSLAFSYQVYGFSYVRDVIIKLICANPQTRTPPSETIFSVYLVRWKETIRRILEQRWRMSCAYPSHQIFNPCTDRAASPAPWL